jgi:hypothetical protein
MISGLEIKNVGEQSRRHGGVIKVNNRTSGTKEV